MTCYEQVKTPFIRNWLDLLCFLLSGLPANGTLTAEVAFMFDEWFRPSKYRSWCGIDWYIGILRLRG
jgi:hypothetical protein